MDVKGKEDEEPSTSSTSSKTTSKNKNVAAEKEINEEDKNDPMYQNRQYYSAHRRQYSQNYNGNDPVYGGGYSSYVCQNNQYQNKQRQHNYYLPYASSSSQTASAASASAAVAEEHWQNGNKDTVAIAGEDLSNVPASVIIQLEKANRTIAAQNVEIERLRSFKSQNAETHMLKKQNNELEKEMRNSRERFLEQQELLAEMSRELDNLLREKLHMQASLNEIEKKYRKAKMATKELAKILENDMCSNTKLLHNGGFESDDEDETAMTLFQKSRTLCRQQESKELKMKAEKVAEKVEDRRKKDDERQQMELMEKVLSDNENLLIELDRERRMTSSLQDDLEKNRRMLLDRDETIEELNSKLSKSEAKTKQSELDLSRTSTDLALERARCDALTLELHELDAIFAQTQSTVQAFALENEQLDEKCQDANRMILSLNAKLEAQGNDLVTTKKTLRAFREAVEKKQKNGPSV